MLLILPSLVAAQTATPPPTAGPTPSAIEALKSKLATRAAQLTDDLKEKIATATAETIRKSVSSGTIATIDKKNLTIKTKSGSKTLGLTQATVIKGKSRGTVADLKPDQRVVVVASGREGGALALRVYTLPDKPQRAKTIYFGMVTEAATKSLTIQDLKASKVEEFVLDNNTEVSVKGQKTADFSKVTRGAKVVIITEDDGGEKLALRIHVTGTTTLSSPSPTPKEKSEKLSTQAAAMERVVLLAQQKLAGHLNVPSGKLKVVSKESVTWVDTSLGVKEAGKVYAQVITPGYKIVFSLDNDKYEMHTDATGKSMVLVEPLKRF